jgi:hypothetical protein
VTLQELIDRTDVQRDVLIYGMENNGGIPMEVAFTIAKTIQLETFFQEAREDERVFKAVVSLMDSLFTEAQPLGGMADLENWQQIYETYAELLAQRKVDIAVLRALRSIEMFLNDKDLPWNRRASELMRVKKEFEEGLNVEVVRKGLSDQDNRWMALSLIKERNINELLPEVIDILKIDHDFQAISVLGSIGDASHLEFLLAAIPEIVNLDHRKTSAPKSKNSPRGPQYMETMIYTEILGHLGKLGSDEALAQVLKAGEDFEPIVRVAACKAIRSFPEEKITQAVKDMIEKCLYDPSEHVAKTAQDIARELGLQ